MLVSSVFPLSVFFNKFCNFSYLFWKQVFQYTLWHLMYRSLLGHCCTSFNPIIVYLLHMYVSVHRWCLRVHLFPLTVMYRTFGVPDFYPSLPSLTHGQRRKTRLLSLVSLTIWNTHIHIYVCVYSIHMCVYII